MKTNRFLSLCTAAVLALGLWSCAKSDSKGTQDYIFQLSSESVIEEGQPVDGQTLQVTASDNVEWRVKSVAGDSGWITVAGLNTSATGNGEITYSLTENTDQSPRVGTFTVEACKVIGDKRDLFRVVDVSIRQMGLAPYLFISTAPTALQSVNGRGATGLVVSVKSNVSWQAAAFEGDSGTTPNSGWITLTQDTGDMSGSVVFDVASNDDPGVRTGSIVVTSEDGTMSDRIVVKQLEIPQISGILIEGMNSYLKDGAAVLTLRPQPSGADLTVDVDVDVAVTDGTAISSETAIPQGEYLMVDIKYPADASAIPLGGLVTITSALTWTSERWDNLFTVFGGESAARPVYISSPADLATLATAVNGGDSYSGVYLKLKQSIALSGDWTPIGNADGNPFKGHFDGGGNSVSGLKPASTSALCGLFGYVAGSASARASISNLTLNAAVVSGASVVGTLVAKADYTDISAITVSGVSMTQASTGSVLLAGGGVVGVASNCVIQDCAVVGGAISSSVTPVGGICGWMDATQVIGCYNSSTLSMTVGGATLFAALGGLVAIITDSPGSLVYASKNGSAINISVNNVRAGGLVGWNGLPKAQTSYTGTQDIASGTPGKGGTIVGCYNAADYTNNGANGWSKGGLVGTNFGAILGCYFTGNFTNTQGVSGPYAAPLVGVNKGVLLYSYAQSNVTNKLVGPLVASGPDIADPTVKYFSATDWPAAAMPGWDTAPGATVTALQVVVDAAGTKQDITAQGWLASFPAWVQPWAADYAVDGFDATTPAASAFPKLAGGAERND